MNHAISAVLCSREDEHRIHLRLLQQLDEQGVLPFTRHRIDGVRDGAGRLRATADLNDDRLTQILSSKCLDLGWHRRAEQQRLSIAWNVVDDPIELRCKPHVEHAVGFVEDQYLEVVEADVASLHVIEQSPRSCNHDIDAASQRF